MIAVTEIGLATDGIFKTEEVLEVPSVLFSRALNGYLRKGVKQQRRLNAN